MIKVKPIDEFGDKLKFYVQLDFDNDSTAVTTADNQFFKNPNGIFYDASVMTTTKIKAVLYVNQRRNRQVGTHRIDRDFDLINSDLWVKISYERDDLSFIGPSP
ncbi:MAG: hypothetical protein ACE5L7_10170 [Candidatus Aminicenantales bacterium]